MELRQKVDIGVIGLIIVGFVAIMQVSLLPALLAGMVTFLMMRFSEGLMNQYMRLGHMSKVVSTIVISLIIIGFLTLISVYSISWLYKTVSNPDLLVNEITNVLDKTIKDLPPKIAGMFPQDIHKLKESIVEFMKENLFILRDFSRGATHTLITMILGMIIGIMIAASDSIATDKIFIQSLKTRYSHLIESFKHVMVAQAGIAFFNAVMTAIFLLVIMPLFDVHFPFSKTIIILTFVIGLIPIAGNLIVNAIVLLVGLSVSPYVGLSAFAYLIFIHKFEYFLNAKIIGSRIEAKAFELLIAMLIMESIFGVVGLIAAPILYCYLKKELKYNNVI